MAASCAVQLTPKNGVTEERVALETWPDTATEVNIVPSQVNATSLVPPDKAPVGSNMVKLLLMVLTEAAKDSAAMHTINSDAKNSILNFFMTVTSLNFVGNTGKILPKRGIL